MLRIARPPSRRTLCAMHPTTDTLTKRKLRHRNISTPLITVLRLLIILSLFSCAVKRQKETVATYLGHDINGVYGRGGTDTWEFTIDGKTYRDDAWNGYIVGAKYIMVYDSLKPIKNNKIILERPVFIKEEKTDTTIGVITKKSSFASHKTFMGISYKYQVKGTAYEWWEWKKCDIGDSILPKAGDKYVVEYWTGNPKRSIVHFDKKIK